MRTRARRTLAWLIALASLAALASIGGCLYDPNYQGAHCGPGEACPDGFSCDPVDKVCVSDDFEPAPVDGRDGASGDDGGLDAGDDAGVDGADEIQPDGGDEVADDGGGDPGGDAGPCGGCLEGFWCNEGEDSCQPCNTSEHCGLKCLGCEEEEVCDNLGADGFCCLGPCGYANACQRVDCNGHTYMCKAFFPLTYTWIDVEAVPSMICALSDQDGIVADRYTCNPQDESTLLYYCPWGGSCEDDGTCQPDPVYSKTHACGAQFGCDQDHCRMHLRDGQTCSFNYDCESFCCSQDAEATCLPFGDGSQCKITKSLFWRSADLRSFEATGPTPHDRSAWISDGSYSSPHCTNDESCDSGHCRYFALALEDRCELASCVSKGSDQDIRDSYFCDIPSHEMTVTNKDPWPEVPSACVYSE